MSVKEHDEFEQAVQSIIKQFHHQNLNDQRKHLNRPSVQQLGEWLSKGDKTDVINTIVHCQNAPALASIFFCLNDLDINDTVAVMCKTDSKFKVNFTELLLVNNNLDVRQLSFTNLIFQLIFLFLIFHNSFFLNFNAFYFIHTSLFVYHYTDQQLDGNAFNSCR